MKIIKYLLRKLKGNKKEVYKHYYSQGHWYVVFTRFDCPFRQDSEPYKCTLCGECYCNTDFPKGCPLEDAE